MARASIMKTSVSLAQAMSILSACLVFGVLIGLVSHNNSGNFSGGRNLRSAGGQAPQQLQQQQHPTGEPGVLRPKIPDMSLFDLSAPQLHRGKEERDLAEVNDIIWSGGFASIQLQAFETVDPMEFSISFEDSFSYDF